MLLHAAESEPIDAALLEFLAQWAPGDETWLDATLSAELQGKAKAEDRKVDDED
ncbi:hypothetical protein QVG61_00875 [Thiohalobacter sp. IOR34]|uniref:hypothetical protein n=1 Tax=Thiohalobacter sp. IOR34 TaxID=3057176 RepID=UPI0025AF2496|nr:hypothetical protein [Thiohalobacter sp. IOR34]WJW75672.1 hypothetical protein QVG61_00875 [Thiohalobacter sp. IOR34]